MEMSSQLATTSGPASLKRVAKRLGLRPRDVAVASSQSGQGLVVCIYRVPGIDAERLASEFRSVIFRLPGSVWEDREIAGKRMTWASGTQFDLAFWAPRDGLVVHVAGEERDIEVAVARLP